MKDSLSYLIVVLLLAGCATDRFVLVDRETREEYGPFLLHTGAPVQIGEKSYSIKRLLPRDEILRDRMKSYIIPVMDFQDAHIRDVVAIFREPGIVWDSHDAVVNTRMDILLVVPADKMESVPRVTFSASHISLYHTIEILAELTGLDFMIVDGHAWLKWED